jgi:lysophospholipase L1-like esterase
MNRGPFLFLLALACSGATGVGYSTRNITAWGDSLTDGQPFTPADAYPTQLAGLFPDRVVLNEGVGGETSSQILARMRADTSHRHDVTVLWMGRNNYADPKRVLSDVAAAVKSLGTDRFIVLSILNGDFGGYEAKGAPGYQTIMDINSQLVFSYGTHFLDIRAFLVSLYDPAEPVDVRNHHADIPPSSLRAHWNGEIDALHLSPEGNSRVAERVAQFISQKGW